MVSRFRFLFGSYTIGRTSWTSDRPVARPLPKYWTAQTRINSHTHTHTHTKHPCPKWDSNPRSRPPSEDGSGLRPLGYRDRPLYIIYIYIYGCTRSRDSSVGIATGSGLDRRGVWTSSLGRDKMFLFSTSSRPILGPTQPLIQWVPEAYCRG
jgi:hypothetical protein